MLISKFKCIIIVFVFIPFTTIIAEAKPVTVPIVEDIRINNFPLTISKIVELPSNGKRILFLYKRFGDSAYCAMRNNAVAINFCWRKIRTAINLHAKKNLSVKGWGLTIVRYCKTDIMTAVHFIYNKIRSIANFHGFFRNTILTTTYIDGHNRSKNQSYILYKCKIYALAILSLISIGTFIVSISLMFQPSIRAFFGFGFSAFIFAMIAHVSIEKGVDLKLFGKPNTAYMTNETGFAFNMLMILIGIIIGLIVMYFLLPNAKLTRKKGM